MPEWVKVRYTHDRPVYIDGDLSGRVGQLLQVERGTHTFNMGSPRDYEPMWRRPLVENTNPFKPYEVWFEPK